MLNTSGRVAIFYFAGCGRSTAMLKDASLPHEVTCDLFEAVEDLALGAPSLSDSKQPLGKRNGDEELVDPQPAATAPSMDRYFSLTDVQDGDSSQKWSFKQVGRYLVVGKMGASSSRSQRPCFDRLQRVCWTCHSSPFFDDDDAAGFSEVLADDSVTVPSRSSSRRANSHAPLVEFCPK